jgi:hypothetical protein
MACTLCSTGITLGNNIEESGFFPMIFPIPTIYDPSLNSSIHHYLKKARKEETSLSPKDIKSTINWIPDSLEFCTQSETYRLVVLILDLCKYHHANTLPFIFLPSPRLKELSELIFKFKYSLISRKVLDILVLVIIYTFNESESRTVNQSEIVEVL